MNLEMRPGLSLQQKQAMSPRLLQALGLLQLPVLELAGALQAEIQENPFLETSEDDGDSDDGRELEPGVTETGDWDPEAFFAGEYATREKSYAEPQAVSLENMGVSWVSLREDLLLQLYACNLNKREQMIGEYLIQSLDDDGYLRDPESLIGSFEHPDEAARIVARLKEFEPAGVFARDLQECLDIQVQRYDMGDSLPGRIVTSHFVLLSAGRFSELADKLGVSREQILEAVTVIRQQLQPKPGAGYTTESATLPYPDLTIIERDGRWEVLVVESPYPRLQISHFYMDLWRANPNDPQLQQYLRDKLERAQWIMRSVEQRRSTLLRIGQVLLEWQKAFFTHGPAHLRRMTLADVAGTVEVHISTVSRAVSGKYVQTPYGLLPLKSFFQSGVDTRTGGDRSAVSVKKMIGDLVSAEDPRRPLSDDQLALQLRQKGLVIARRTVSKYREELGIPSSRTRIR